MAHEREITAFHAGLFNVGQYVEEGGKVSDDSAVFLFVFANRIKPPHYPLGTDERAEPCKSLKSFIQRRHIGLKVRTIVDRIVEDGIVFLQQFIKQCMIDKSGKIL